MQYPLETYRGEKTPEKEIQEVRERSESHPLWVRNQRLFLACLPTALTLPTDQRMEATEGCEKRNTYYEERARYGIFPPSVSPRYGV